MTIEAKYESTVTRLYLTVGALVWLVIMLSFQIYAAYTELENTQALLTDTYCPKK